MIRKLYIIEAAGIDPYPNMGLEEYLMVHCGEGECILYLWQNEKTVVIGRNQNAYGECQSEALEADGGRLARRLSGGGAVFHDLGNLNFTFLVRAADYDVVRQTEVILQAVKKLGADAERTGRNDITIDQRKFSGNAFYQTGACCCHHGTLLLHVDKEAMSRYLNVSPRKLQSKGVSSVRSRVINLCEVIKGITAKIMAECLAESFGEVYGLAVEAFPKARLDREELITRTSQFASWEWKYGRKLSFHIEDSARFSWGEIQVQVTADQGRIQELVCYTDALDTELVTGIAEALTGISWNRAEIGACLAQVVCRDDVQAVMLGDIKEFICNLPE